MHLVQDVCGLCVKPRSIGQPAFISAPYMLHMHGIAARQARAMATTAVARMAVLQLHSCKAAPATVQALHACLHVAQ